mgnify:FL=1
MENVTKITDSDVLKINQIFDSLAENGSRKVKEEILKNNYSYLPLWQVFNLSLNPFFNYYNVSEHLIPEEESDKIRGYSIDDICSRINNGEINLNTDDGVKLFSALYWGSSKEAQRILKGIVDKDLRVGVGAKTLNKVKAHAVSIIPYMRCSLPSQVPFEKINWGQGVIAQEKCDGMFINVNNTDKGLEMYSRTGNRFKYELLFPDVPQEVLMLGLVKDSQSHGELLVFNKKDDMVLPREEGNGILNSVLSGTAMPKEYYARIVIWDSVPLDYALEGIECKIGYKDRFLKMTAEYKAALAYLTELPFEHDSEDKANHFVRHLQIVPTKKVHNFAEAQEFYSSMLKQGKEGAILKTFDGTWKDGTSKCQIKMKLVVDCDLKIVGYEEGKGKYEDSVGSVVAETSDELLQVSVSGFDDATRQLIHENREGLIGNVITVRFNNIMEPKEEGEKYSLFLPRFVEFRTDKTEADSLERVKEQLQSAIKSA